MNKLTLQKQSISPSSLYSQCHILYNTNTVIKIIPYDTCYTKNIEYIICKKIMESQQNQRCTYSKSNIVDIYQIGIDIYKKEIIITMELLLVNYSYMNIIDVMSGILQLHELNIVYLDLKKDNLGYSIKDQCFKLFDFNLSTILNHSNEHLYKYVPIYSRAPDIINKHNKNIDYSRITTKTDSWVLGMYLYDLIRNESLLYPEMNQMNLIEVPESYYNDIYNYEYMKHICKTYCGEYANIIIDLLHPDANERMSIDMCVSIIKYNHINSCIECKDISWYEKLHFLWTISFT